MTSRLLVFLHKPTATPPSDGVYLPLHVGRALTPEAIEGIVGDDTGDNISAKNRSYCELTGIYWAWKNLTGTDYIGTCHYRRYFDTLHRGALIDKRYIRFADLATDGVERAPDLAALLGRHDMAITTPRPYSYPLAADYRKQHIEAHLTALRGVLGELHPDYLPAFDHVLYRTNRLSHYNMFICRWDRFDHYAGWLFGLLFELERRIDIPADPVQGRVFGYLAERLLMVYCRHHRLDVKRLPILFVNEGDTKKPRPYVSYLFKVAKNNLLFWLVRPFERKPR